MASWEGWVPRWGGADQGSEDSDTDEECDLDVLGPEISGDEFANMLIDLKLQGTLSATQACVLAYWAWKAGAVGKCCDLAAKPGQATGAYSRRFDTATDTGKTSLDFYNLKVARRLRHSASRIVSPVPMRRPHEALLEELLVDQSSKEAFERGLLNDEVPPLYHNHPAVTNSAPENKPLPFVLYADGVQHNRYDSTIAFTVYWLFSQVRHVIFVIRKHEMCNCGCRGWCTLEPLFQVLRWSFACLLAGKHPADRHDSSAWGAGDEARSSYSGLAMACRALCLLVKGDWSELVQRWGFQLWTHKLNGCPFCKADRNDFFVRLGLSPLGMPMPEKTPEEYEFACKACEVLVNLSADDVRKIRPLLAFDKKKGGRYLRQAVPELGLEEKDVLTPTVSHPDIADLAPEQAPRQAVFWQGHARP